jgi:hypothetical protein
MKIAADGLPETGATARTLGVRPGVDVPAIHPSHIVVPGTGGLSVAPIDPFNLALARRPPAFGGTGKDPLWYIESEDLILGVIVRRDSPTHALVEPASSMTLLGFQLLLASSRTNWKRA